MTLRAFQVLIGTALTDTDFRKALLNGSRRTILQSSSFSGDEIEKMMRISTDSLEQFAMELHSQLIAGSGDLELEPLPRVPKRPRYADEA
jgi:hypothetical protein